MRARKIITAVSILAASMLTASMPTWASTAEPKPAFVPPGPRTVVLVHCGPDVTSGRIALVHRGGRHYDVVAVSGSARGMIRCRFVAQATPVTP